MVFTSGVWAAKVSRDEYQATVEPIRKRNTQANERILKGVAREVKRDKLKPVAAKSPRLRRPCRRPTLPAHGRGRGLVVLGCRQASGSWEGTMPVAGLSSPDRSTVCSKGHVPISDDPELETI